MRAKLHLFFLQIFLFTSIYAGVPGVDRAAAISGPARNLQLISHSGGATNAVFNNGGVLYAGFGSELAALNLNDLAHPARLGSVIVSGIIEDISVSGGYAYTANGDSGFSVVNVQNPANPVLVASHDTPGHANGIFGANGYVYVADETEGLEIYQLAASGRLAPVGTLKTTSPVHDVVVDGVYAYAAADTVGLWVVDVSNPLAPREVSSYMGPVHGYYGLSALRLEYDRGNIFMVGQTLGLRVIRVSDPAQPREAGFLEADAAGFPRYLSLDGSRAYTTGNLSGISVIDLSNPNEPVALGSYDFHSQWKHTRGIAGNKGYAYVGTELQGLRVVNMVKPLTAYEAGSFSELGFAKDVAILGNYAYVTGGVTAPGLATVNLANPAAPNLTGRVAGYYSYVAAGNGYIYVDNGDFYPPRLVVFSLSNPAEPKNVNQVDLDGSFYSMKISGQYAYIGTGYPKNGLSVLSLANPAAPVKMGSISAINEVMGLDLVSPYAYVPNNWDLDIVDISNPAAPVLAGHGLSFGGGTHTVSAAAANGYAYVTYQNYGRPGGGVWVSDISQPGFGHPVGGIAYAQGEPSGIAVEGSYAYVAAGSAGVRVLSINEPANPVEIGYFLTGGNASQVRVAGDYLVVAADQAGLFIFSKLLPPFTITGKVSHANGLPVSGATVTLGGGAVAKSDTNGRYSFASVPAGAYRLTPSLTSYSFWPITQTVSGPPNTEAMGFTLLPRPVSFTLLPDLPAETGFEDTQGLLTHLVFPPQTVTQPVTITLSAVMASIPGGQAFAAHAFDLSPSLVFHQSVTVTIGYSDADLRLVSDESNLALWLWNGEKWQDAAQSCSPASSYVRDLAQNTLSIPVCASGRFALVGPTHPVFLPLLTRDQP